MMDVMEKGKELPKEIADVVANAMRKTGLWIRVQLTIRTGSNQWPGITAEKHDAFINPTSYLLLFQIRGKELIKGEPDASSFQVEDCVPHSKPEDIPHGIQLL